MHILAGLNVWAPLQMAQVSMLVAVTMHNHVHGLICSSFAGAYSYRANSCCSHVILGSDTIGDEHDCGCTANASLRWCAWKLTVVKPCHVKLCILTMHFCWCTARCLLPKQELLQGCTQACTYWTGTYPMNDGWMNGWCQSKMLPVLSWK